VNVSIETEVNGPFLLRSPNRGFSRYSRGLLNAPEDVVIVRQDAGGKAAVGHLLSGDFGPNCLVAPDLPAREHLSEMSPRKTVYIVAQRIESEPIEVAGFPFLKQLAVAEMSEQTLGIGNLREPLPSSGQYPLEDGLPWPKQVEAVAT
jgi:hypothetical protein